MKFETISILDVSIVNVAKEDALRHVSSIIYSSQKKPIFFVNANNLIHAYYNTNYRNILNQTEHIYGDGIGVKIAGKLTDQTIVDNVNGTDLFPMLCDLSTQKQYSFYFLGSKPGIVEKMSQYLKKEYPSLIISGMHHGYFDFEKESDAIIQNINALKTNILLVGFGTPKQEEWIFQNIQSLNCNVIMGVGGLFDFYSGVRKRAPLWMRNYGLEWFFRLVQEPFRLWRRYVIGIPKFVYLVVYEKLRKREL